MSNHEPSTIYEFRKELENLGYGKGTVNQYSKQVKVFLEHYKKHYLKIQTADILDYYNHLKIIKGSRTKKPFSESYTHTILLAIKSFYDYLQRTGIQKNNPYQLKIRSPKTNERKVFTEEQIQQFYQQSNELQTIILHLCYACGLRRSEAIELKIKDIDIENKLLYVRNGKGKKRRVIPFTNQLKRDFEAFLDTRHKTQDDRLLDKNPYTEFRKLLKNSPLGLGEFTLHCLRHTIATTLLNKGMDLEKVRDFLGHNQLSTTQIYTRIIKN